MSFASEASLDYPLGHDGAAAIAILSRIDAGGGTNIPAGITAAHSELAGVQNNPSVSQVIILLSDGKAKVKGEAAIAAAQSAKDAGIRIITIGLGRDAEEDRDLLRAIASSEQDTYYQPTSAQLIETFLNIAQHIHACGISVLPTPTGEATSTPIPVLISTLAPTTSSTEPPTPTSSMPTDILLTTVAAYDRGKNNSSTSRSFSSLRADGRVLRRRKRDQVPALQLVSYLLRRARMRQRAVSCPHDLALAQVA